jgi:hypothetical protein
LQVMKDIGAISSPGITYHREDLAKLREEGSPELKKPRETDWSDPSWNKFSKRELDRIKQEVRTKQERAVAEAVIQWEREKNAYESKVAHLEAMIDEERNRLKETVTKHLSPLHESMNAVPASEILDRYEACIAYSKQLRERLDRWKQVLKDHEPAASGNNLTHAGGITHIIHGDQHYIDNKVIEIPAEFRSLYYGGAAGPNEVVVSGMFRFAGNAKGRNALGATINVERYECDQEYSLSLIAQRKYASGVADLSNALKGVADGDLLAGADHLLKAILGEAKYKAAVSEHAVLAGE